MQTTWSSLTRLTIPKKRLIRRYSAIHHNLLAKKPNTSNVRWGKLFEKAKTKESVQVIYLLL